MLPEAEGLGGRSGFSGEKELDGRVCTVDSLESPSGESVPFGNRKPLKALEASVVMVIEVHLQ